MIKQVIRLADPLYPNAAKRLRFPLHPGPSLVRDEKCLVAGNLLIRSLLPGGTLMKAATTPRFSWVGRSRPGACRRAWMLSHAI